MAFLGTTIAQATQRFRAPRKRTLIKASITSDCLPAQDVVVRNVSEDGVGLGLTSHAVLPRKDEKITIHFANGLRATGRVAWVEGRNFGVQLDQEVHVDLLVQATQRQNAITSRSCEWQVEDRYVWTPPAPSAYRACMV